MDVSSSFPAKFISYMEVKVNRKAPDRKERGLGVFQPKLLLLAVTLVEHVANACCRLRES